MAEDMHDDAGAGMPPRPRRSCLYLPGTNARAQEKARGLAADVLIFDLEDSVAPEAKAEARARVVAALEAGGYGRRELVVRVNALASPWGADDLAAVAATPAHAALLPKVTGPEEIAAAGALLDKAGAQARLWVMMETARAILEADAIAQAHPRLAAFAMGLEDLTAETGADGAFPRTALLYALERSVLVARAHGLCVLDGVHAALDDDDSLRAACAQGRALGFDGKQVIHPKQIAAANAAFAPSAGELDEARRVIAAFEAARARGAHVAVLDGRMVEALHAERARRLVAFAGMIGDSG